MQPNPQIGRWLDNSINNIQSGEVIEFTDLLRIGREVLDGIYYTLARVGIHYRIDHNHATVLANYFHRELAVRMIDSWPEVDSEAWNSFEVAEPEISLMVMIVRNFLASQKTAPVAVS